MMRGFIREYPKGTGHQPILPAAVAAGCGGGSDDDDGGDTPGPLGPPPAAINSRFFRTFSYTVCANTTELQYGPDRREC